MWKSTCSRGEREMASDNRTLGRFILDGIPPAPRGVPQIEVTFDIDANGILHVSAKDKATGKEQSIRIEATTGLTKEEIERMQEEAKKFAAEDKKKRERAEALNRADQLAYQTEKNIKELGDKLDADSKSKLESAVSRLREAMKSENVDQINSASEELSRIWNEVSSKIYQQAQPGEQAGTTADAGQQAGGENVQEAEFEVVDDDKDKNKN
ncbi:MAG: Hsp70 family protein [candidate division KSB1 bacterium]|nr:Hsp70 family protein [candidate division KSB1 bacterium]